MFTLVLDIMDIQFLITTYNRQGSCQRLVDGLQGLGDILVLNDGCDYEIKGCRQEFQNHHNGRYRYFATVNNLFSLRSFSPYYIMLPDDFLMNAKQMETTIGLWRTIMDDSKICLNLYTDRMGQKCWTKFQPILKGDIWLSQWVDMCFLCENRFFEVLGTIPRINLNWKKRPNMSSGVGAYISRKLFKKGFNLYQVTESLITPQESHWLNSQMYATDNYSDGYHTIPPSKLTRIIE